VIHIRYDVLKSAKFTISSKSLVMKVPDITAVSIFNFKTREFFFSDPVHYRITTCWQFVAYKTNSLENNYII